MLPNLPGRILGDRFAHGDRPAYRPALSQRHYALRREREHDHGVNAADS
jgi:glycine cleavage system pyridoxal-binding protein P